MINFKQKDFSSSKASIVKRLAKYIKKYPLIPISSASLSIGAANYAYNKKKSQEDFKLQEKQVQAMKDLTKALNKTTKALKEDENARKKKTQDKKKENDEKKSSPSFKQKSKKK